MRSSILLSWLCATLATGALVIACGDDDEKAGPAAVLEGSGPGESCTRTSDCTGDLVCVNNFCQADVGGGGEGSGPPPGAVGEEGESCASRSDCASGLRCIEQVCTASSGAGGEGNVPTGRAGGIGETCQNVRDCEEGLTCIPDPFTALGICDLDEYGLEPTGNVCGAECKTAADCCELPQNMTISDGITITSVFSCADLVAAIAGADCAGAALPQRTNQACFYLQTYCGTCAMAAWECTDNRCVYTADCDNNGDVLGGCPVRTRAGSSITSTCDTAGTGKCVAPAGMGCTTEASCNSQPVADQLADTCSVDECTCYQSGCYRKCNENLDCPFRYECDTTNEVCTPIGACATHTECAASMGDVRAQCRAGACVIPCSNDQECSASGAANGSPFTGIVCSAAGICEPLGCTSDDECGVSAGGVHTFCTPPVPSRTGGAVSAITD
jgi:hypothetical protein